MYSWSDKHGVFYETAQDLSNMNMFAERFNDAYEFLGVTFGDTVLEVGSYLGRFAHMAFMDLAKKVVSYEPYHRNFNILKVTSTNTNFRAASQEHVIVNKGLMVGKNTVGGLLPVAMTRNPAYTQVYQHAVEHPVHKVQGQRLAVALHEHQPNVLILDVSNGLPYLMDKEAIDLMYNLKSFLLIFNSLRGKSDTSLMKQRLNRLNNSGFIMAQHQNAYSYHKR